jgi:predicted phage terminase large subunit-like protein
MKSIRYWDKAGTEGAGCRTAGVLLHHVKMDEGEQFVIEDVVKGQWDYAKRERMIKLTAQMDGKSTVIWTEQEPGSGGKESAQRTVSNLAGYTINADPVGASDGNKERRAEPFSSQVNVGNVYLVAGEWNKDFIAECGMFPRGTFKDQVDAASGAFNKTTLGKKRGGTW